MAFVGKYERMTVERAYELGMISQIVDPPEQLRDEAQALAEKIARNSPAAMAATKKALWGALEHGPHRRLPRRRAAPRRMWGHPDQEEGPRAFAEKREPDWADARATDPLGEDTSRRERRRPARRRARARGRADDRRAVGHAVAGAPRRRRDQGRAPRRAANPVGRRRRSSPTPTAGASAPRSCATTSTSAASASTSAAGRRARRGARRSHATSSSRTSRPARSTRFGLDHATLAAAQPRLIYVSITGFGTTSLPTATSPYESWPAYASIAEAMSGIYEWGRATRTAARRQPRRRARRHRHAACSR